MLEIFCSVFMLIGSIIGAGFASGKEIAVYFCPCASNPFYLIVFTIFNVIFVFSCLVLSSKTSSINNLTKAANIDEQNSK